MTWTIQSKAYDAGVEAKRQGLPVDNNPYPNKGDDTDEQKNNRKRWFSGWYDWHYHVKYGEPWTRSLRDHGIEP